MSSASIISKVVPDPDNYRFVLRRYDRDPVEPILIQSYDEAEYSRAVPMRGVVAHTVFLRQEATRDRYTKQGWVDETAAWKAELHEEDMKLSDFEQQIVDVIANASTPIGKADIAARLNVQPYDIKHPLERLRKIGQVVMEGTNVHARYVLAV